MTPNCELLASNALADGLYWLSNGCNVRLTPCEPIVGTIDANFMSQNSQWIFRCSLR